MPNPSIKSRVIGVIVFSIIGFAVLLYMVIRQDLGSGLVSDFLPSHTSIGIILLTIVFILLSGFILVVATTAKLAISTSNILINRRHKNKHPNVRGYIPINIRSNKVGKKYRAQFAPKNSSSKVEEKEQ